MRKNTKVTAWLKIKAEYLSGVTPKELGIKYNLKPKQISDKANEERWVDEKSEISENLRVDVQNDINRQARKALGTLEEIIDDPETEKNVKVQACKAILDVSGLKRSTQEINGNVGVQKIFITPEEIKETDEHIDNVLNEQ